MPVPPASRPLAALAALLVLAALAPATAVAGAPDPSNPLAGQRQFIDCEAGRTSSAPRFSAWYYFARSRGTSRRLLAKIAHVPTVKWFTAAPTDPVGPLSRQQERYFANVDHPQLGGASCAERIGYSGREWSAGPVPDADRDSYVGSYPVVAFRALNDKSCGGDADPGNRYRDRIDALAHQLGRTYDASDPYRFWSSGPPPFARWRPYRARGAAVILEPDALGLMGRRARHCVSGGQKTTALALLRYGVEQLGGLQGVSVYIDAGAGDWLHVDEAVTLLRRAGVHGARGFALNASHFNSTSEELAFGERVARRLDTHFVVNTAENARDVGGANCNPAGAGLGREPTTSTGSVRADAFLWISRPGISSNAGNRCGRGPDTNVWFQAQALSLARHAAFDRASWPPKPL
jgi:hypothetical protein